MITISFYSWIAFADGSCTARVVNWSVLSVGPTSISKGLRKRTKKPLGENPGIEKIGCIT